MSALLKFFVGSIAVLSMAACAPKFDDPSDDFKKQLDQIKRDSEESQRKADEAAARARSDAAQKAIKDIEDSMTRSRDMNAAGSQPGSIFLNGALASSPAVTTESTVGVGWRGDSKPLNASALIKGKYNPKDFAPAGTYINLGCQDLREVRGFKEVKPKSDDKIAEYNAEIVLICDAQIKLQKSLKIRAGKLLLNNVSVELVGISLVDQISVLADELELRGSNSFVSRAEDGVLTMWPSPQVTFGTDTLSGGGTLAIASHGASYKAAPSTAPVVGQ